MTDRDLFILATLFMGAAAAMFAEEIALSYCTINPFDRLILGVFFLIVGICIFGYRMYFQRRGESNEA